MASPLDLGLGMINQFSIVFAMLFVFVLLYAVLGKTKVLGDNKNVVAIIAFVVAIMLLMAPNVSKVITTIAPWFVLMFIFMVFIIIGAKLLGATDDDVRTAITGNRNSALWWIIILSAIILIAGLGKVYFSPGAMGDDNDDRPTVYLENGTTVIRGEVGTEGESALWATIFHPKVLGFIVIMLVGVFAIVQLTRPVKFA